MKNMVVRGAWALGVCMVFVGGCSSSRMTPQGGCPLGQSVCGDACVALSSDSQNCGRCGNDCGGAACVSGFCSIVPSDTPDGGTSCSAGQTRCGDRCVNVTNDPNNCGACANACGQGSLCNAGVCEDPCAPYSTCAVNGATYCADLAHDINNCGTCGDSCGAGFLCESGACVPNCSLGSSPCPTADPTYCATLGTDELNCGACGTVCAGGATCSGGICQCPSATTSAVCSGQCVDLDDDANHCGACGTICNTGPGETCQGGVCGCPGSAPEICGGVCADVATDSNNCGACGHQCDASAPYCAAGQCTGAATSCAAILAASPGAASGVYYITAGGGAPFQVYCDMVTDGGGWTVCAQQDFTVNGNSLGQTSLSTHWGTPGATTTFGADCVRSMTGIAPGGTVEFGLKGSYADEWQWVYPFDTTNFSEHLLGTRNTPCDGPHVTECKGSESSGVVAVDKATACHSMAPFRQSEGYFIYQIASSSNVDLLMEIGQANVTNDMNHVIGIRADCGTTGWWVACSRPDSPVEAVLNGGPSYGYATPGQCGTNNRVQGLVSVMFRERGCATVCSGACADTQRDAANCGACGSACAATEVCSSGVCGCPANRATQCAGVCVDVQSDNANCGACGTTCQSGQVCSGGSCGQPSLINIDFASADPVAKTGPAAVSIATTDYWNGFPSSADSTRVMKWSDQSTSTVSVRIQGLGGGWGISGAIPNDSMYANYVYGSPGPVTVTGLPAGSYDFYAYGVTGWPGGYSAVVKDAGGAIVATYPLRTLLSSGYPATFTENYQYIKFDAVPVLDGQSVVFTISVADGYSYLSGMQIMRR